MNLLTVRFFRRLVTSLPTHAARPIRRARNQGAAGLVLFCSNANASSDDGASPATTSSPFLSLSPSGPIQIQSSLDPSTLNGAEQVVRVPQVHRCHLWCPSCVLLRGGDPRGRALLERSRTQTPADPPVDSTQHTGSGGLAMKVRRGWSTSALMPTTAATTGRPQQQQAHRSCGRVHRGRYRSSPPSTGARSTERSRSFESPRSIVATCGAPPVSSFILSLQYFKV